MPNDEYKNNEGERDPFTRFMFGHGTGRNSQPEEAEPEEKHEFEANTDRKSTNRHDDDWLFGGRAAPQKNDDLNSKINNILNNINFEELMNNIDTLVNSASQLKPLLKKASPFIDQFLKK